MATYYTIHCYKPYTAEDIMDSYDLYPTFDMACDAIDEHIRRHIEFWNDCHPDEQDEGDMPDRKEMFASFVGNYLHYYEAQSERLFVICKRKIVPNKPTKKYVYQYFVRNNEQTTSPKYETFDEVCDVLDKELRKLHGENWQPRMTREQYKNYMGDDTYAISYDFYKTDTYVLFRTEV